MKGQCSLFTAPRTVVLIDTNCSVQPDLLAECPDLVVPEGNTGCSGGNMYYSFMYIIFNDGIDTANSYTYQAMVRTNHCIHLSSQFFLQQGPCNFTSRSVGASMSGIIALQSGDEFDLQAAVTYAGPVAAAVDARSYGFRVSDVVM